MWPGCVYRRQQCFGSVAQSPGVTIDMEGNVKLNGQPVSVWITDALLI